MLDNSEDVIKECIELLEIDGKNTKAIVLEKLRGLVENVRTEHDSLRK